MCSFIEKCKYWTSVSVPFQGLSKVLIFSTASSDSYS